MQKVVLAGGSGFIGQYLQKRFEEDGYEVLNISRSGALRWSDEISIINALEGAAILINLAGKSVNCRHTADNKKEILASRVLTTQQLGRCVQQCKLPPPIWINFSTVSIYADSDSVAMDESSAEAGVGFPADVARAWEAAFFAEQQKQVRKIALRITIALGKDGGAWEPYKNLAKFGFGGKQGSGRQMFSWIHVEDVYGIIRFCMSNEDMVGPVNAAAPTPISNEYFMAALRKAYGMPVGLPAAEWMIKIGASILGTESSLLLQSSFVVSKKLKKAGFQFRFPKIEQAINDLKN